MKKKTVALLLACVMLIGVAMGGTLAWLMDATPDVVNTFTVGDIEISLTETTGSNYHYVPGATVSKDPVVTVHAPSEACWLFVKIAENKNTIDGLSGEVVNYEVSDNVDDSVDWVLVDSASNVYGRKVDAIAKDAADVSFQVLKGNKVTINSGVTEAMAEKMDGDGKDVDGSTIDDTSTKPTLTLTAYAIQSDNISATTAVEAWEIYQEND